MNEKQRAGRIVSRIVSLFMGEKGNMLAPGLHTEAWAGLTVTCNMNADGKFELVVVEGPIKGRTTTMRQLFKAEGQSGAPMVVTAWEGGVWERAFVASDA